MDGSRCARSGRVSVFASRSATAGRGFPPTCRRGSSTPSSPPRPSAWAPARGEAPPAGGGKVAQRSGRAGARAPERERQPERGPAALLAFDLDAAAVRLDDHLADGEAEAGARDRQPAGRRGAEEALEEVP